MKNALNTKKERELRGQVGAVVEGPREGRLRCRREVLQRVRLPREAQRAEVLRHVLLRQAVPAGAAESPLDPTQSSLCFLLKG